MSSAIPADSPGTITVSLNQVQTGEQVQTGKQVQTADEKKAAALKTINKFRSSGDPKFAKGIGKMIWSGLVASSSILGAAIAVAGKTAVSAVVGAKLTSLGLVALKVVAVLGCLHPIGLAVVLGLVAAVCLYRAYQGYKLTKKGAIESRGTPGQILRQREKEFVTQEKKKLAVLKSKKEEMKKEAKVLFLLAKSQGFKIEKGDKNNIEKFFSGTEEFHKFNKLKKEAMALKKEIENDRENFKNENRELHHLENQYIKSQEAQKEDPKSADSQLKKDIDKTKTGAVSMAIGGVAAGAAYAFTYAPLSDLFDLTATVVKGFGKVFFYK